MREKDSILKSVLSEKAEKYYSLSNNDGVSHEQVYFAENSYFYEEIMEDGNIFNPYIHRRFLPMQYKEILRKCVNHDITPMECFSKKSGLLYLDRRYDYNYFVRFVIDEVWKLARLEQLDYAAFLERSKMWEFESIKGFLCNYFETLYDNMKKYFRNSWRGSGSASHYYYCGQYIAAKKVTRIDVSGQMVNSYSLDLTIEGYKEKFMLLSKAKNYIRIKNILQNDFYIIKVSNSISYYKDVDWEILKGYNKSGLYFTLKHYAMFEPNFKLDDLTGNELCVHLAEMLDNGNFDLRIEELTDELKKYLFK